MKKMTLALLGSTVAVTLALAGGSAFAADLMAPPPADPVAMTTSGGGYISVFGGYAAMASATGNYWDSTSFNLPLANGYIVGGAIGTSIGSGVRGELELSYSHHDTTGKLGVSVGGSPYFNVPDTGSMSTLYVLGNLWYDFDTGSTITPYIGGGAGLGVLLPSGFEFASGTENFSTAGYGLAAQLGAGVKVNVADNVSLDFGYRLKGVFDATLNPTSGGNHTSTGVNSVEQVVQVGLNFGF